MKVNALFHRGYNIQNTLTELRIFLLQNQFQQNFTHFLGKGVQISSSGWPCLFTRRDNGIVVNQY